MEGFYQNGVGSMRRGLRITLFPGKGELGYHTGWKDLHEERGYNNQNVKGVLGGLLYSFPTEFERTGHSGDKGGVCLGLSPESLSKGKVGTFVNLEKKKGVIDAILKRMIGVFIRESFATHLKAYNAVLRASKSEKAPQVVERVNLAGIQ